MLKWCQRPCRLPEACKSRMALASDDAEAGLICFCAVEILVWHFPVVL